VAILYLRHRITQAKQRRNNSEEVYFKSLIEGNKKEDKIKNPKEKQEILKLKERLRVLAENKEYLNKL
jgi:hypothetical protein